MLIIIMVFIITDCEKSVFIQAYVLQPVLMVPNFASKTSINTILIQLSLDLGLFIYKPAIDYNKPINFFQRIEI